MLKLKKSDLWPQLGQQRKTNDSDTILDPFVVEDICKLFHLQDTITRPGVRDTPRTYFQRKSNVIRWTQTSSVGWTMDPRWQKDKEKRGEALASPLSAC
jgi:hypothetical protein